MMYGNYGGGWMMLIGALVCIAIIGVVVWLLMRAMRNKQVASLSSVTQQQHPYQMNQTPPQQSNEMYQEGVKQHSYPQPLQYSQQQERPLD